MKGNRLLLFVVLCWFILPAYHAEARYYDARVGRFLSVDPASVKYPGWSAYHYALGNPMRFVDPLGKWNAEYDKKGNIVTARAEKGDNLAGLYNQLGVSAKQFGAKYEISESDMSTYKVEAGKTSFNISSFAMSNSSFNADASGSNCFGFVAFAKGATSTEDQVLGGKFFSTINNLTKTGTPNSGDVAVWKYAGNIEGWGDGGDIAGMPAHAAIFLLRNHQGESQYLNRTTLGAPVQISTQASIQRAYEVQAEKFKAVGFTAPSITQHPEYFKTK